MDNQSLYILKTTKHTRDFKDIKALLSPYGDIEIILLTRDKIQQFAVDMAYCLNLPGNPPLPWDDRYVNIKTAEDCKLAHEADFNKYFTSNEAEITGRFLNKIAIYNYAPNGMPEDAKSIIESMDVDEVADMS